MKTRPLWFVLAILFLLYAFYMFVFGLSSPVVNPTLNTLTDRIMRAFISIVIAAAIFIYLIKTKK